jgi:hypothetical protein
MPPEMVPSEMSASMRDSSRSPMGWRLASSTPGTSVRSTIPEAPMMRAIAHAASSALTFSGAPSSESPIEFTTGRKPAESSVRTTEPSPPTISPTSPASNA